MEDNKTEKKLIKLGVLGMDKKIFSQPMANILRELNLNDEFFILYIGESFILNRPVEQWPRVQALITFYSGGFPFKSVLNYVELVKPYLVNDLHYQALLWDRRLVYRILKANDIPTVDNILVLNRSNSPSDFLSENPYQYFSEKEIQEIGGFTALTPEQISNSPRLSKFSPKVKRTHSTNTTHLTPQYQIPKVNSITSIPGLLSTNSKEEPAQSEITINQYEEDAHDDESIHRELIHDFVEFPDYITIKGERLNKPFVEKPIDAEDHKIHIYYPSSQGGGHKRLFRKINNKSSEFIPNQSQVRKTGSYTYERFLRTDGFDIKVYTVGTKYSHAEARKAPTLDGRVLRQANGKETRYPVLLSPNEKDIVKRVVQVFKQRVCGFDMLRSNGKSYVCDVNGWSFVKGSAKYFKDCGIVLRNMLLTYFTPQTLINTKPQYDPTVQMMVPKLLFKHRPLLGVVPEKHEELRAVVAVIRHGDRTPKQKMKMVVKDDRLLSFFDHARDPEKELKLKKPQKLQKLLDHVRTILKENE